MATGVVAEIAQRHLLPAARDSVGRLLGGRSLADVVNWQDELRSDPRFDKYKPLHFTVPDGVNSYRDAKKDKCGDVVVAIAALSSFLKTGTRDNLFAVKALTDKSDGTAKRGLQPSRDRSHLARHGAPAARAFHGRSPSAAARRRHRSRRQHDPRQLVESLADDLHSTWDDEMVDYERLGYLEYAQFLDHVSEADAARWRTGDTIAWADEAVIMRPKLYVLPDDRRPFVAPVSPAAPAVSYLVSYGYIGAQRDRMREQMLKGGLRLASVLNTIFK